jgi:DNA repair exonuclease SbcCD ATPase subunit
MIIFNKLRWKNFISTGNVFTEIKLDDEASTLVVGGNGSGKSTFLDAICFALFGKPFRNINKAQLINTINQKDAIVEVEFTTSGKSYKIIRGIKPNIFEIYCDGKLITQSAAVKDYQEHLEKFILKLNYKSFTQIVILGSASFTPFMQLAAAERRSIIEDLLDIQIFSRMNSVLKDKVAALKDDLNTGKYSMDLIKEKITMQTKYINNIKQDKQNQIDVYNENINTEVENIKTYAVAATAVALEISALEDSVADKEVNAKILTKYSGLKDNLNKTALKVDKDIKFYTENNDCPTCKQTLTESFKSDMIDERKVKLAQVVEGMKTLSVRNAEVNARQEEIIQVLKNIAAQQKSFNSIQSQIIVSERYIHKTQQEIAALSAETGNIEVEQSKLTGLEKSCQDHEDVIRDLTEKRSYFDVAATLLKDTGIKTKIIRQYIPVINKLVNKYLATMDFFVNFNLDESFKETIKSRHRDEFSYASFSEGEKQRIDMALMLTWRAVAKMKNSANTNILILDEVFDSSLDTNGTEDLMKILGMLDDTNLFVISHKGDILQDKFRNVIKFEKVNNFSRMIK